MTPTGELQRWNSLTRDPNSRTALEHRAKQLARARRPVVPDRDAYLVGLAEGREVLDVGCVDHVFDDSTQCAPLHRKLVRVARSCLGVDLLVEEVSALRDAGYPVVCADVCSNEFRTAIEERTFDVVVAGEIIEHVTDLAAFITNLRMVLKPDGLLALTTPNPFSLRQISTHSRGRITENVDHVTYLFPSGIQELADRCGMELVSYRGAQSAQTYNHHLRLAAQTIQRLLRLTPEVLCYSMIYELRRLP